LFFFFLGTSNITVGADINSALSGSARRVSGHISAGGQYHFYMETQAAVACTVDGDNITVTCGSQYPSAYQAQIATVLGVPLNKVIVKCPRTGGAFGGKIMRGIPISCAAALCSTKLGRPVRIFNTRTADMAQQSKLITVIYPFSSPFFFLKYIECNFQADAKAGSPTTRLVSARTVPSPP
jgi:xanthine dehydrogenase molybdopterin-binding subunit B